MKLSDELRSSLKEHFHWGKPRLEIFIALLMALLKVQDMNLARLAVAVDSHAHIASRYRRLQRFFSEVHFDYDSIARLIMFIFDFEDESYYLTLDRTNWKYGKSDLNILTLAIAYKGAAIPIYWLILNKKGNSNQRERIALLSRFIHRFNRHSIRSILGDREFIGQDWWRWLTVQSIPFIMRMKKNQHYKIKGKSRPVEHLFRTLQAGESRVLRKTRFVSHQHVYLSALRLETGELLILASNRYEFKSFEIYAKRWEIETLFQCLKGRGFNMESTRITDYRRIKKVVALLAISYCWAMKTGEWRHDHIKKLRLKSHHRMEKSLFRYGLDFLADKLFSATLTSLEEVQLYCLLICPTSWFHDPTKMRKY